MSGRPLWNDVDADLYQVLRVAPDASDGQIQDAWRRLAKRTHPDAGGDGSQFRDVHVAYLVLSDPSSRVEYDRARRVPAVGAAAASGRAPVSTTPGPVDQPVRADTPEMGHWWLWALAGALALVLSYLWPWFTVITGIVVGVVVTRGYIRMARLRH